MARSRHNRLAAHIRGSRIAILEANNGPALALTVIDEQDPVGSIGTSHITAPG